MKANIYVDGFNLYYGLVKGTPYKWLDLSTLFRLLLPGDDIHRIRYFTALIEPTSDDPQKRQRQQTYIRALKTIPNLSVHYGHFLSYPKRMPLADPSPNGPRTVEVINTEEKGSDVNLATYLLVDGFDGDYEVAVVVSNDSDLVGPIRMVRERLRLPVGVLNPQRNTSIALLKAASFYRPIRQGVLKVSQFPPILTDATGTFTKPSTW
jgi:hypothetical protein